RHLSRLRSDPARREADSRAGQRVGNLRGARRQRGPARRDGGQGVHHSGRRCRGGTLSRFVQNQRANRPVDLRNPWLAYGLRSQRLPLDRDVGRTAKSSTKGEVMKIVVIGGTGLIGSKVVSKLTQRGHEALAAAPNTGVNTITGEGLAEALEG